MTKAEVEKAIEEIIRNQFADSRIEAVRVEEDTDFDGDNILRVTVVFGGRKGVDPIKAKGLVRHIRSNLADDQLAFPVVAFRSSSDDKRLKAAAA